MIWFEFALFIASFILTAVLAPRPKFENERPASLDDFTYPRADEGDPVAILLGKCRALAPNTIWYGNLVPVPVTHKMDAGFMKSVDVIVAWRYFLGFDLALCLGPNSKLRRIWIDKDEVWAGTATGGGIAVSVDRPDLFGGKERGGGFVAGFPVEINPHQEGGDGLLAQGATYYTAGPLRFYGGSYTPVVNAYLNNLLGGDIPAYNGLCRVVGEGVYIGEYPRLATMSFEVERYPSDLGLTSGVLTVGEDINPMEALYQIMTQDWGGLGVNPNDIDLASLRAVATVLKNEGNGISLLITKVNSGKSLIEEILRQIDGVLFQDPLTGQIKIKLIRADYDPQLIPSFNASNIKAVRSFNRSSWADTINQVRVVFPYRGPNAQGKYEDAVAMVQDMANIASQGRIRSSKVSFPGCTEPALAVKLATRELAQWSVPMYNISIEINRLAGSLRPGDAFKFSWPAYGITDLIMRVQKFDLGELVDGRIVVDAVQDKFGVNAVVYGTPPPTIWERPNGDAVAILYSALYEAPSWIIRHQKDLVFPSTNETYAFAWAQSPQVDPLTSMLAYSVPITQDNWVTRVLGVDHAIFTDTALLAQAVGKTVGWETGDTTGFTFKIKNPWPYALFLTNLYTTLGQVQADGANLFMVDEELMSFVSVTNNGDGTWTLHNVKRALLDTEYLDHSLNARCWFIRNLSGLARTKLGGQATVKARFLSWTGVDEYLFSDAFDVVKVMNRRYERPLPPDYIEIAGGRSAAYTVARGDHVVAWRERSRDDTLIRMENDVTQTAEAGTTYNVYLYLGGNLYDSELGVAGTSTTVTSTGGPAGAAEIRIEAVRSGLTSFTQAKYWFTVT